MSVQTIKRIWIGVLGAACLALAGRPAGAADLELKLDSENSKASLAYKGQDRLEDLECALYHESGVYTTAADGKAVLDGKTEIAEGVDAVGPYREASTPFSTPVGRFSRRLRVYPERNLAALSIALEEPKAGFDLERSVSVDAARLPGFKEGLFFSVERYPPPAGGEGKSLFSRYPHDINQVGNRKIVDLNQLPRGGNFFLWQEKDGAYGAVVPLNTDGCRGWLGNDQDTPGLQCVSAAFDKNYALGNVAVALVAFGDDPYALTEGAYQAAMKIMNGPGKLRAQKTYPEVFDYLGWCTWEAFRKDINADKIRGAVKTIEAAGAPVRFVLIDDGWQSVNGRKMTGFDADPALFPGGIKPLIDDLKADGRIRWVGVWHTLIGYWDGIDPESELGRRYADRLVESETGTFYPSPRGNDAFDFFNDWHLFLREQGVDFVKVDDQARSGVYSVNIVPINMSGQNLLHSLDASASLHMDTVLNCMAMATQCVYNWINSSIVRVSIDYRANDAGRSRMALMNGLYNPLWVANFCWPDGDMFYSSEQYAPIHAIARAISGGPIYLSDPPESINVENVMPLCLSDGRLLRVDVPGVPTKDSLFIDPSLDPVLLKETAAANGAGMLALFNLFEKDQPLSREFSSGDLIAEAIRADRYFVYSHAEGKGRVAKAGETIESKTLAPLEADMVVFAPVVNDVAVVGLVNKLVSPATVSERRDYPGSVEIDLRDDGEFLAFVGHSGAEVWLDNQKLTLADDAKAPASLVEGQLRIDTAKRSDKASLPRIRIEWK